MRGVYIYGVSTIATAAASHSTIGCFFDREPDNVRTFKVYASFGKKNPTLDVFGTLTPTVWQWSKGRDPNYSDIGWPIRHK